MRASVLSAVILALGLCAFVSGQAHMGCHSTTPVYGYVNNMPILDGNSNLELLRTTTNGTLYQLTVPNNGSDSAQTFFVVHVWGSAYQQGFAYGTLLRNETQAFMTQVWSYVEDQVEEVLIPYLPEWAANLIAEIGLDGALDFTYDITEPYTDPDFYEEMHGLCDAAGVSFNLAKRLHMIPSITKGACSMFGAWGKAVPKSAPHLLQLRALDWDMTGPFRDFSAITVYHGDKANSSNGHSWVNVGMVGFIAALTGISEYQLAISEIGVSYPDASWGPPQGLVPIPSIPFVVLLRDILKYDHTIDDSISRMANAKRDCNLILGVGDGKAGYFRGFQYSPNVFTVYDPENMAPNNSTWHPKMPGVVYWGMDWQCPSFNYVLAQQLEKFYGNITPENAIHYISSVEQSGDNHLAFYDLTSMDLYLAFAAPHASTGPAEAYYRQFTHFNVHALFRENPPN